MTMNLAPLFIKGINRHFFLRLRTYDPAWRRIFHVDSTSDRYIWAQGWGGYTLPTFRIPGEAVTSANFFPDFSKQYIIRSFALSDQCAQEDIDDDLYGVLNMVLARKGGLFARSFMDLLEIQTANYFGTQGFASGSSVAGMADGVSLFNTAHPQSAVDTVTTWSNRPSVDADLSITTAQFLFTNLWLQKAPNNITILNNRLRALVINPIQHFVAHQIFKQDWTPYTADRTKSFIDKENVEIIEWPYFTKGGTTGGAFGSGAANAYFGIGEEHHLYFYLRQPVRFKTDESVTTLSQIFVGSTRFDMGADSARGTAGSTGA